MERGRRLIFSLYPHPPQFARRGARAGGAERRKKAPAHRLANHVPWRCYLIGVIASYPFVDRPLHNRLCLLIPISSNWVNAGEDAVQGKDLPVRTNPVDASVQWVCLVTVRPKSLKAFKTERVVSARFRKPLRGNSAIHFLFGCHLLLCGAPLDSAGIG